MAATKTATARSTSPVIIHAAAATINAIGTKRSAHVFARRTPGADFACAALTNLMIPSYVLFSAVDVATNSKGAPAFNTPLDTASFSTRCTGSGSPVRADSSRVAVPSKFPSHGVISPPRTNNRSPMRISSMAI